MTASRNQLCALQSLMRKSKLHKPVFHRSLIDEARADVAQAERVRARAASGQPGVNKLQRRKMRLVDLKSSTSQTVDGEASTQATPQEWHTQSVDREATVDEKFQRAVVERARTSARSQHGRRAGNNTRSKTMRLRDMKGPRTWDAAAASAAGPTDPLFQNQWAVKSHDKNTAADERFQLAMAARAKRACVCHLPFTSIHPAPSFFCQDVTKSYTQALCVQQRCIKISAGFLRAVLLRRHTHAAAAAGANRNNLP